MRSGTALDNCWHACISDTLQKLLCLEELGRYGNERPTPMPAGYSLIGWTEDQTAPTRSTEPWTLNSHQFSLLRAHTSLAGSVVFHVLTHRCAHVFCESSVALYMITALRTP